jgi:hypothetical protein
MVELLLRSYNSPSLLVRGHNNVNVPSPALLAFVNSNPSLVEFGKDIRRKGFEPFIEFFALCDVLADRQGLHSDAVESIRPRHRLNPTLESKHLFSQVTQQTQDSGRNLNARFRLGFFRNMPPEVPCLAAATGKPASLNFEVVFRNRLPSPTSATRNRLSSVEGDRPRLRLCPWISGLPSAS